VTYAIHEFGKVAVVTAAAIDKISPTEARRLAQELLHAAELAEKPAYELGVLPNRRGGFHHIHSNMTECGMAYLDGGDIGEWRPCGKLVNHDGDCGYENHSAF
jgi:hypothetical protein